MCKEGINTIVASVVASAIVSGAIAYGVAGGSSDAAVSSKVVEDYLLANPNTIRESLRLAAQQEQIEAEKRIAEGYKANIEELNNADNSPFVGPKDAKVTIVEFFDFNCGYCKRLAPAMAKIIKANPDVKFVFKPVTFLGSMPVAKAAMAAHKKGKFLEVYEALLTHNGQLTASVIEEKIEEVGLDWDEIKEIMESEEVKKDLAEISALSNKVGIRGVPTLIINGNPLQAIDEAPIQNAINNLK